MNKLVWTEDGKQFHVIDKHNLLRCPKRAELSRYTTKQEIRNALRWYELSTYPLPSYDIDADMYYWDDPNDLWTAEEISGDLRMIGWRYDHIAPLLELARSTARLERPLTHRAHGA